MVLGGLDALFGDETLRRAVDAMPAATFGSAVSASVAQPIDVASRVARKENENILRAFVKVVQRSGWTGLFRGHHFQILRRVPTKAIRVVTYEWSNALLDKVRSADNGISLPKIVDNLVVSVFSAAFSVAVTYPLHVLYMFHSRGIRMSSLSRSRFFRGVIPLCLSSIPSVSAELFVYNCLRDHNPDRPKSFMNFLTLSLAARMAGQTLSQPLKVVSKKIAIGDANGIRSTFSTIVEKSGPQGLFKGLPAKYLKTLISVSVAKLAAAKLGLDSSSKK
eukprot:Plantae.Rhodophyta-Purpureofilum_apyrenoidigerum.ctg960.p1 GENE.Plantae.Rhodophyta-Purpureofilum_apyrenoidigerum.ctg960~~Plantae.Rhodophyta-Purpureofilum_apyrenoidigerum.ctg960.p1  ORF type:complete len:277 (-),score=36.54 Plantae.Rhodophyta-Purpureofilum_apyrenoidigerum.ctg960:200-1030(-)